MNTEQLKLLQSEMTNKDLINKAKHQISELARTGGKSHIMCVPPEITDTDMLLSELVNRFENLLSKENDELLKNGVIDHDLLEQPYFDKNGKVIKEFALLKVYHFFGVNDQGRGRKHYYMYKWVRIKEIKGKLYYVALHLTKGDNNSYNLRAVADKQTRIIKDCEIVQSY